MAVRSGSMNLHHAIVPRRKKVQGDWYDITVGTLIRKSDIKDGASQLASHSMWYIIVPSRASTRGFRCTKSSKTLLPQRKQSI